MTLKYTHKIGWKQTFYEMSCSFDLSPTHSPHLLPEVAKIPYGFILQLRAEQRVGLGQDGYQPTKKTTG